jgi:hypothetical protein
MTGLLSPRIASFWLAVWPWRYGAQKMIASANDVPRNKRCGSQPTLRTMFQKNDRLCERCSEKWSPLRTIWLRIALRTNRPANESPCERCSPKKWSPLRTIWLRIALRTTPNELSLVLWKSEDSVITFQRKRGFLALNRSPSGTPLLKNFRYSKVAIRYWINSSKRDWL